MADIQIENHGTIALVRPVSDAGHAWCDAHLPEDAQRLGAAVAVEPRYISDIIEGMLTDGLDVQGLDAR